MVKTGYSRPSDSNPAVMLDIGDPYPGRAQLLQYYPNLFPNLKIAGITSGGRNNFGALGLNDTIDRSSPTQIGLLTNWSTIACGVDGNIRGHAAAVDKNGNLWTWGSNFYGQLGIGTTSNASSPIQVGLLTNWATVTIGNGGAVAAIKTDASLWTWGSGSNGSLGSNASVDRSSPVQVGLLTNWAYVSSGNGNMLAIKKDGTLWAWGYNGLGQLGLGDANNRSSPTQVGLLTNWRSVYAGGTISAAIKTDGTLWTWGSNSSGGIGNSTTTSYSSPIQIGLLTNWAYVSTGSDHMLAIKTDGTLWGCGNNDYGQLGLSDLTNRSSPTQIGLLTNWKTISCGSYSSFNIAIKTDGTAWSWGNNDYGPLCTGDTVHRSSPVQIGSLTNWKLLTSGGYPSTPRTGITIGIVQGTDF